MSTFLFSAFPTFSCKIFGIYQNFFYLSPLVKILAFENENKSRFILHFAHLFVSLHAEDYTLMLDRAQTIEILQSSRQYLSEHYGVSSMLLFGSVARNEQKEDSDVDVCVEMKPNLFKQAGVKVYLQELLGCPVDVVRLRENMNQLFKQQILKYGVRVY